MIPVALVAIIIFACREDFEAVIPSQGRGRDTGCPVPPAPIRTCGAGVTGQPVDSSEPGGSDGVLEVSRLARDNADWYRLLELCGVTDTLLGDSDGVYRPALFNYRRLLGLNRPDHPGVRASLYLVHSI